MEQALTDGAAGAVPSTLELLLGADVVSVKANMPTARYEISQLSEAAGAPVVFRRPVSSMPTSSDLSRRCWRGRCDTWLSSQLSTVPVGRPAEA
mgnify:CR=1 FL=1